MKRFLSVALACCFLTFTACSDDDDSILDGNEAVEQAFNKKYPNVNAEWEMDRGYFKAEFYENNVEKDAWFTQAGEWVMTSWDVLPASLPAKVLEAVQKLGYTQLNIDDAELIEYKDGKTYYKLEIEQAGLDRDYFFTPEGEEVKNPIA